MRSCLSCKSPPKKTKGKSPTRKSPKQKQKLSCTNLQKKVRNFNLNKSNYSLNNFNFSVCMSRKEKKEMLNALRLYQEKLLKQAKAKLNVKAYEKVERHKFRVPILNTPSPKSSKSIENELNRLKKEINSPIRLSSIELKPVKRSPK